MTERRREYFRRYGKLNRERRNAQARLRRKENPERHREYDRLWTERNRERFNASHAARSKIRRKENPERHRAWRRKYDKKQQERADFRIQKNLSLRISIAIRGITKSARTMELIGMELEEFKNYFRGKFRPGMTWENWGPVWHIDHIRPCASFDLTLPEQQKICFNWSNLQPLFAEENLRKGAKYDFR